MKQRVIFFILGLVTGVILGATVMSIVWQSKSLTVANQPEKVDLQGMVVCLPHKNTDGPQTLECATGIQTTTNKTYGLSSTKDASALVGAAGSDKKVHVTGTIQPARDTDIYKTDGTLTVASYEFLP